jgi:hypothetical protein
MKLESVKKSTRDDKKYMATFSDGDKTIKTHFGAKGYDDYTITKDKEQRERYRDRHQKDLKTNDPTKAGYLSYYLLWGPSTSLRENIKSYKKKFNL